jgi:hypothetical protein
LKSIKLESWIGVVGNLAVVAGLVVVAIELRQNSIVANGELSSQFQGHWQEMDRSRQDPSFAIVYAKSIEQPEELTLAEKVQLDGYYWTAMDQLDLAQDLVESGLFESPYEEIVRSNVRYIFTTPYARAWWASYKELSDPITISIVDDELSRFPAETAQTFFDSISPDSPE